MSLHVYSTVTEDIFLAEFLGEKNVETELPFTNLIQNPINSI